jgi:hypothetical protein
MKPTELRLMNLIYNKQGNTVYVNTNHLTILLYGIENEFKPIPLTEEWLLKFGFYKNIDTELFEKGGFQIEISELKCLFYLPEFGDWRKVIQYVHQLQNLWFALTGEELTFKQQEQ